MDSRINLARDFERESHRIDQEIWDAMALRSGETVLFCGFNNDVDWIRRAIEVGVNVSVIASDEAAIASFRELDIAVLKGSTTMIPARDASFDAAVAFHYLHEIDPFFHANVVSELARVGKRLIVVEPAPPTDPLGLRIAGLYSRAKRELGQFEYYQNVDYWKKLLSIVKADVVQSVFSFNRVPPRSAIKETVSIILDTMAAEDTPELYLEELRALAKRPDAQLVPQSRYVLVGALSGAVPAEGAGTLYREKPDAPEPEPTPIRVATPVRPTVYQTSSEPEMPPFVPSGPTPFVPPVFARAETSAQAVPASPAPAPVPPPVAPQPAEPVFGFGTAAVPPGSWDQAPNTAVAPEAPPFGIPFAPPAEAPVPFGIPGAVGPGDPLPKSGFGWEWEPPENPDIPPKPAE